MKSFVLASPPAPAVQSRVAPMKVAVSLLCAFFLVAAVPAWAISSDEAVAAATRAVPGRVLSIEMRQAAGRSVWRVTIRTSQNEVRVILIDDVTGRPI